MLKVKQKTKTKEIFDHAKQTAKMINGKYRELTCKMWEIGKILIERYNDIKDLWKKSKGDYFEIVANEMEEDLARRTLYYCAKFYERYPDLAARAAQTGLSPKHYEVLSFVGDNEIRDEMEEEAIKNKLTIKELKEKITETIRTEPELFIQHVNHFVGSINKWGNSFDYAKEHSLIRKMNDAQKLLAIKTIVAFIENDLKPFGKKLYVSMKEKPKVKKIVKWFE